MAPRGAAAHTIVAMCRVLAYLGAPLALPEVLFDSDSSLVRQTYSPRMMSTFLNLAGFGMAAWDPRSITPEDPFTYRTTTLPGFDRNLGNLARKLAPTCLVAHVRGVTHGDQEVVAQTNLHPFHFPGTRVALAHNGHLREFSRMRYDLVEHIGPALAQRIQGTTDSEWVYALVLAQLGDPYAKPGAEELADAVVRALGILREIRARHGIETSSPANLCLTTGDALVATRFSFDYGWYPDEDTLLETDLPFVSLWYTLGDAYVRPNGGSAAGLLIASEPLSVDVAGWLEVPEYSMLTAQSTPDGLDVRTLDLDV
jgi:glutamine amidotransferase